MGRAIDEWLMRKVPICVMRRKRPRRTCAQLGLRDRSRAAPAGGTARRSTACPAGGTVAPDSRYAEAFIGDILQVSPRTCCRRWPHGHSIKAAVTAFSLWIGLPRNHQTGSRFSGSGVVDLANRWCLPHRAASEAAFITYQPERPMDSCSCSGLASVFCEMLRSRQTFRIETDHPACLRLRGLRM